VRFKIPESDAVKAAFEKPDLVERFQVPDMELEDVKKPRIDPRLVPPALLAAMRK
jgi:hypothetical protein